MEGSGNGGATRARTFSGSPWEPIIGFSRAIRVGDRVIVSGTAPIRADGEVDADPAAQARRCLEIIVGALAELGAAPRDVVRTRIYLTDGRDAEPIGRVHGEILGEAQPASTMVVVSRLLDPRWRVEIEAEAVIAPGSASAASTPEAPEAPGTAIGPITES